MRLKRKARVAVIGVVGAAFVRKGVRLVEVDIIIDLEKDNIKKGTQEKGTQEKVVIKII
jgi:isoprenylcysteine carboxyl methyltransferase (ICMT) family protein YpbQ